MFCSACGQPVNSPQPFCSNCGAPLPQAVPMGMPMSAYMPDRVRRHIQALSILWIAYGVWTFLHWMIALSIFGGRFGSYFGSWNHGPFSEFPFTHMHSLLPIITIMLAGRCILSVLVGVTLARRVRSARIFALVMAFLTIFRPITGTILAIYTLWVLIPAASRVEYEQISV
jgi:hypothetical protein